MAELQKLWQDGESLTITYDGDGDGSAVFTSTTNEGIDREVNVAFVDASRSIVVERKVSQEGLREIFEEGFILADGGTFNVIKGKPDYSTWRGVFIQDVNGDLYEIDKWNDSKVANGIALQTDKVSLVVALKDAYTSYCTWGTRSNIAGVNNSDSQATIKTYFNGETETDAIIANAANSTAATYCKNYVFPNGQQGYMGAAGEWFEVLTYKGKIINAMNVCGGTVPAKDYWCTTEQVGSNRAWAADWEGAVLTNYNKTASSSVKVRAFCKLKY